MRDHLAHEVRQCLAGEPGKRHPAHAFRRRRAARRPRHVHRKLERKMREDMRDDAGQAPPRHVLRPRPRQLARRQARRRCRNRAPRPSSALRSCRRAARAAVACAPAVPRRHGPPRRRRRGAAALRSSASCADRMQGRRRAAPRNAPSMDRARRRASCGVQIVAPRSISAWASRPAASLRRQGFGERADLRLWRRAAVRRLRTAARPRARYCRRRASPG